MIKVQKQLAVIEDLEVGQGTVTQDRDVDGTGIKPVVYNKINAGNIPTTAGFIQGDLNERYTKAETDGKYPLITNVLTKTNTTPFTPTVDYAPATKKFVDDAIITAGAGDMTKSVYDVLNNGIVDNAELFLGDNQDKFTVTRPNVADADLVILPGSYAGTDILNTPLGGIAIIELVVTNALVLQRFHSQIAGTTTYIRYHNGTVWGSWILVPSSSGATFTGQVKGIAPVSAEDLTRKDYVDNKYLSGSNANGTYIKFDDGTLICKTTINVGTITIASNTVFISETMAWTYPFPFSEPPVISASGNGIMGWFMTYSSSNTSGNIVAASSVSHNFTSTARVTAIGRWK